MTDVFIAHNSKDKADVGRIAQLLTDRNVTVWFDEEEIPPGADVNKEINRGLRKCKKFAIFLGRYGPGDYQNVEIGAILRRALDKHLPIIPVHLPEYTEGEEELAQLAAYRPVVFHGSIEDEHALEQLIWAITEIKPSGQQATGAARPIPPPPQEPVTRAIQRLANGASNYGLTIYVGPRSCSDERNCLPSQPEVAKDLLRSLDVIDEGYEELLPQLNDIGLYYATREGITGLESTLSDKFGSRAHTIPLVYRELAALLKRLYDKPAERARPTSEVQLVFTTNLDSLIEIALLSAGMPFSRLVQDGTCPRVFRSEFTKVKLIGNDEVRIHSGDRELGVVKVDDLEELQRIVSRAEPTPIDTGGTRNRSVILKELQQPVLYKYHGSLDVHGSSTISADRYFSLTSMPRAVPDSIKENISNRAGLFIGYSLLDPEFQQSYQSFIKDAFGQFESLCELRYIIEKMPNPEANGYQRIEAAVWQELCTDWSKRMMLCMLESKPEEFLRRLCEAIG